LDFLQIIWYTIIWHQILKMKPVDIWECA